MSSGRIATGKGHSRPRCFGPSSCGPVPGEPWLPEGSRKWCAQPVSPWFPLSSPQNVFAHTFVNLRAAAQVPSGFGPAASRPRLMPASSKGVGKDVPAYETASAGTSRNGLRSCNLPGSAAKRREILDNTTSSVLRMTIACAQGLKIRLSLSLMMDAAGAESVLTSSA